MHLIETDLFKTNLICVMLTVPMNKDCVTKNALIPFLLRRGTEKLPSQYEINKEMENMYGASFNCGIDKTGDNIILKFYFVNPIELLPSPMCLVDNIVLMLNSTFHILLL